MTERNTKQLFADPPKRTTRPTCTSCHAIDGIEGSPTPDGGWVSHADIIIRYGLDYDERSAWRDAATCEPAVTELVGGTCQWCRGAVEV
jgi:hypothetical protein